MTYFVFIAGLVAGAALNLLLLRTIFAPPFRLCPRRSREAGRA